MKPNPQGLTICCLGCGRDTKAKDGYCASCKGGMFGKLGQGRGRKALPQHTTESLPDDDDKEDEDPDFQYHGSNID